MLLIERITGRLSRHPPKHILPRPNFESGEIALAGDALVTQAHGFGAKPILVQVVARCVTDDIGYIAGEELDIGTLSGVTTTGAAFFWDVTNVYIAVDTSAMHVIRKDTFVKATATNASWKWVIRAWK